MTIGHPGRRRSSTLAAIGALVSLVALLGCDDERTCDQASEHLRDCLELGEPTPSGAIDDSGQCTATAACMARCTLVASCSDLQVAFNRKEGPSDGAQAFVRCTDTCVTSP